MSEQEQKHIFAQNLKRLLEENDKTQAEVAKAIRVSPQTFNTWIKEIALPRMGKVQALADYFHVSKSDLIDEVDYTLKELAIDKLLNEYLNDAKIRELVLFAGGMPPGEDRDKLIDAVISVLSATVRSQR